MQYRDEDVGDISRLATPAIEGLLSFVRIWLFLVSAVISQLIMAFYKYYSVYRFNTPLNP